MPWDASSRIDPDSHRRVTVASRVFAILVALQGALALAGWFMGIEPLKGAYALGINIKTNTAIGLLLVGFALLLLGPPRRRAWRCSWRVFACWASRCLEACIRSSAHSSASATGATISR